MRLSNLFTALLKEIVNSAKKVSMFEEDGGLYTLIQNHLFLDMVISVQIVSLRFVSRSLSLFLIIPFLTNVFVSIPTIPYFIVPCVKLSRREARV